MKIGFVFTNYNNSLLTKEAVDSIYLNCGARDYQIVIVDNHSDDNHIDVLNNIKYKYPDIHLILNDDNYGYFKGLNCGIKHIRNMDVDIQHIVIGNNDLIFPSNFINSLYGKKNIFDLHAVVSPDIVTLDGEHQNPHVIKKVSFIRELIWDIYYMNYNVALIIKYIAKYTKYFTRRRDYTKYKYARIINQGYGACYILGPVFFKYFNSLWAPTFLMGEEVFLSAQLKNKNINIYYEPSIQVLHHDHATIDQLPTKKLWELTRDSHLLYRKHIKSLIIDKIKGI